MVDGIILYSTRGVDTVNKLISVAQEKFNKTLIKTVDESNARYKSRMYNCPILYYGLGDNFNLTKKQQLEFFSDIISNTLIDISTLNLSDIIVIKEPTMITTVKEYKRLINSGRNIFNSTYIYIPNKTEWRINYSFGKVNNIYNKNLLPSSVFGKAELTQWSPENDREIRSKLIELTKKIAKKLLENGKDIQHFGLDILRNNDDGQYYLLELNKAHALNDESCYFLLRGFFNNSTDNNVSEEFREPSPIRESIGQRFRTISNRASDELSRLRFWGSLEIY